MRLTVLFLLLLVFALPAQAQQQEKQFYVKKKIQTNIEQAEQPAVPAAEEDDPLAVLRDEPPPLEPVFTIDESQPVGPQFANAYFESCMKAEHKSFTPQGKEMMCGCTSAKILEELSEEELRVMGANTPEGQIVRDKITIHVYAPCISFPTSDLIYTRCMQDVAVKSMLKKHAEVCACLGEGMAEWVNKNSQTFMAATLRREPNNLDPLGGLIDSYGFKQQEKAYMQHCIQTHELSIR
jgi:hypothetical protein